MDFVCSKCGSTTCHSWKTLLVEGEMIAFCGDCVRVRTFRSEPSAVYKREDGSSFVVDQRGNVMDKNPYKNDPRGWRRAGKRTDGYRRSVFLDQGGSAIKEVKH